MTKTIAELYQLAEQNGVNVDTMHLDSVDALSLMTADGSCFIAMDASDQQYEKEKLAHELGHCMTGSFYSAAAAFDTRERHERRADRWAFRKILPPDDLQQAFRQGVVEIWELADLFDVSEDFMRRACQYYRSCGII